MPKGSICYKLLYLFFILYSSNFSQQQNLISCMLIRVARLQALSLKRHFHALQFLSLLCTTPHPVPLNDAIFDISALIKKPNWQKNIRLKSLISHLNPQSVSRIIASYNNDIPLCLNFFKLACKQSTYCYDIDSRIQLLYMLATDHLFGILHKVLIWLINECCSSQVDLMKVMAAIEYMREKNGFRVNYPCYSTLLMCLAKLDLGSIAFSVFKRMLEDGFVASGLDYRNVINALCKNGFVQAAEMFVSRVLKLGLALDVYIYTSLVLGNCRAGELGNAFKVFDIMSEKDNCSVNSVTYSILVHGLCEVGKLDEACKLKEKMIEQGCKPSTRTYTVLIKAMSDRGLINQAFGLFDEMIKNSCKPNVHTYTVLIDMLCGDGKIEEANGLFRKMLNDGLNPGVVTYNALIDCYCKEGRVVSGFELLGLMERRKCKPNIRTYNELIEGLCKIDRPHKAVALLRKVVDNGLLPNEVTFNILIVGFCRAGQINMAFKIFQSMNSFGLEPDQFSYTAFIDSLCKTKKLEHAGVFMGMMIKKGIYLDEVTLTALIYGYCQNGNTKVALLLFEKVVKDRFLTGPHIFNIILDVLGKEVKLVEENAVFGKMLKHGLVPSVVTYTILVDGLCRAGHINASLKTLELMKLAGCPPNVCTYSLIINALRKNGKSEDADNLLTEMQKNNPFDAYKFLITGLCRTGRMSEVDALIQEMVKRGLIPDSDICASIVTHFCRNGDYTRSLEWMKRLDGYGCVISFASYGAVIVGLQNEGRFDEADWLISEFARNAGVEDRSAISSYIDFLAKEEGPFITFELLKLMEQIGQKERPIV